MRLRNVQRKPHLRISRGMIIVWNPMWLHIKIELSSIDTHMNWTICPHLTTPNKKFTDIILLNLLPKNWAFKIRLLKNISHQGNKPFPKIVSATSNLQTISFQSQICPKPRTFPKQDCQKLTIESKNGRRVYRIRPVKRRHLLTVPNQFRSDEKRHL